MSQYDSILKFLDDVSDVKSNAASSNGNSGSKTSQSAPEPYIWDKWDSQEHADDDSDRNVASSETYYKSSLFLQAKESIEDVADEIRAKVENMKSELKNKLLQVKELKQMIKHELEVIQSRKSQHDRISAKQLAKIDTKWSTDIEQQLSFLNSLISDVDNIKVQQQALQAKWQEIRDVSRWTSLLASVEEECIKEMRTEMKRWSMQEKSRIETEQVRREPQMKKDAAKSLEPKLQALIDRHRSDLAEARAEQERQLVEWRMIEQDRLQKGLSLRLDNLRSNIDKDLSMEYNNNEKWLEKLSAMHEEEKSDLTRRCDDRRQLLLDNHKNKLSDETYRFESACQVVIRNESAQSSIIDQNRLKLIEEYESNLSGERLTIEARMKVELEAAKQRRYKELQDDMMKEFSKLESDLVSRNRMEIDKALNDLTRVRNNELAQLIADEDAKHDNEAKEQDRLNQEMKVEEDAMMKRAMELQASISQIKNEIENILAPELADKRKELSSLQGMESELASTLSSIQQRHTEFHRTRLARIEEEQEASSLKIERLRLKISETKSLIDSELCSHQETISTMTSTHKSRLDQIRNKVDKITSRKQVQIDAMSQEYSRLLLSVSEVMSKIESSRNDRAMK